MGFTLKVEGNTTIELGTTSITGVKVSTDIPQDSNARSTVFMIKAKKVIT